MSSIPSRDLPKIKLFYGSDKVIHAVIYFMFCWLTHRALLHQKIPLLAQLSLFLALVATAVYGCSDEFHQLFVAGRSADIYDLMADMFGGSAYAAWYMFVVKRKRGGTPTMAGS